MAANILKPLAVFCSQSQSEQYIKKVRNLGDAWRTLSEEPALDSDRDSVVIEARFDFIMKITNALAEVEPISVEMTTSRTPSSPELHAQNEPIRHYRIFADYGTDFIWRSLHDIRHDEDSHVESEEILSPFPSALLDLYDAWVDEYTDNFKKRCEDTQDYSANVFSTVSEEVAWNVAGYLLAWRIAIAPQIGSVEFSAGRSEYLLKRGRETSVTRQFLEDQAKLLAERKPSE
ncbi:hypothetical protein Plec18167_000539 [Paecilomyces lecythidis]|uniref:Uncharacterized protein n=1 Tax=Paecilomyces lecythidis TaxID=3004212 RepID=A0ABR3YED5_9EURO